MRKLIVNGDDFGFNREITNGIIECHTKGVLTSTTLMVNMPAAEYAAAESRKYPKLSVGIHLSLTTGRPISDPRKIPALVNPDGTFKDLLEIVSRAKHFRLPVKQIELEFTNQVEKFLSLGITPTHCDSHHSTTVNPQPCIAMMRVLKKYNIKRLRTYRGLYRLDKADGWKLSNLLKMLRVNTIRGPKSIYYELLHRYWRLKGYRLPDVKYGFYKVISSSPLRYDLAGWAAVLKSLPEGICELVTHPSLPSDDPLDDVEFRKKRVLQYELYSNPKTKELCEEFGVELVNYEAV
jgi:predicted glycoside hydrolase/deacetylase ChbG (UPF0249 family)